MSATVVSILILSSYLAQLRLTDNRFKLTCIFLLLSTWQPKQNQFGNLVNGQRLRELDELHVLFDQLPRLCRQFPIGRSGAALPTLVRDINATKFM